MSSMFIGLNAKKEPRENLRVVTRALAINARILMLPGSLATLVSGLVLTLMMYGGAGASLGVSPWLMMMQGFGLIGAILTLVFVVPNAGRLAQVDPITHAVQFDQMRQKQARLGMISGILGMVALIAGALGRP
jgi:hypothetical protein